MSASEFIKNEPVGVAEGVRAIIVSAIGLLVAFNAWNPSVEQVAQILGFYATLSALMAIVVRAKSTPTDKVALMKKDVELIEAGQNAPKA